MKLEKTLEEFMSNLQKARLAKINLEPVTEQKEEVLESIRQLSELILSDEKTAEIKIEQDPLLGTCLELNVVADTITFRDMHKFCKAIAPASNFIIYPDLDNKQNFCVTYQGVYRIVR